MNGMPFVVQSGAGRLKLFDNVQIDTTATGTYDLAADSGIDYGNRSPYVTNEGTFEKTGGTGTSAIGVPFNNQGGTVEADSGGHTEVNRFKFADHAVPELVKRVSALGARRPMLEAVLVGGASMFAGTGSSLEVGSRNEAAVRAELVRVSGCRSSGVSGPLRTRLSSSSGFNP